MLTFALVKTKLERTRQPISKQPKERMVTLRIYYPSGTVKENVYENRVDAMADYHAYKNEENGEDFGYVLVENGVEYELN